MNKLYLWGILLVFMGGSCKTKKLARPETNFDKPVPNNYVNPALASNGNKYTAETYIERFKFIAVDEMNTHKIPASIKLAQGLLESGIGNSELARQANNHFGIKCNSDWRGKSVFKDDDEKNECFRVYSTPEESYRDHSEFLKRKRYANLFELKIDDYQGWARGLKEAGYATNPKYPELLISLIERYQLQRFDAIDRPLDRVRRLEPLTPEIVKDSSLEKTTESVKKSLKMQVYEVRAGDTVYSISRRFGLSIEELKLLNNIHGDTVNLGQLLLVSK